MLLVLQYILILTLQRVKLETRNCWKLLLCAIRPLTSLLLRVNVKLIHRLLVGVKKLPHVLKTQMILPLTQHHADGSLISLVIICSKDKSIYMSINNL